MLEGDLASINGRDRTEAFNDCMKKNFPGIKVFGEATELGRRDRRVRSCRPTLTANPDIKGVYMQSSFAPGRHARRCSSRRACWSPPNDPKHVFVVSNDGIPEELKAIARGQDRRHRLPAGRPLRQVRACTTSRPRSTGKTFKPGPTDHDSTIIQVRAGLLEDQLSAPLVTGRRTYGGVHSVKSDDKSLWGNNLS